MIQIEVKQKLRRLNCSAATGGAFLPMWDRIAALWCRNLHSKAMWPIHGKYICPSCLREYPVQWDGTTESGRAAPRPHSRLRPSFLWSFKRSDSL
jgi:hypothetical protein